MVLVGPESEFRTPHPHTLRPESLIRTLTGCLLYCLGEFFIKTVTFSVHLTHT